MKRNPSIIPIDKDQVAEEKITYQYFYGAA